MKFLRMGFLVGLLALSVAAAVQAQDDVNINDGRVNANQLLGGIGIFCEDQNGVVSRDYANGGISVWNAAGEKLLFASAADIALAQDQFPLINIGGMNVDMAQQGAAGSMDSDTQSSTTGATQGTSGGFQTLRFGSQTAGLLAETDTRPYQLYAAGDETFYLIGQDEYGRQFLYQWTGCTNENAQLSSFVFPRTTTGTTRSTTGVSATVTTAPNATTTATQVAPTQTSPAVTPTATQGS